MSQRTLETQSRRAFADHSSSTLRVEVIATELNARPRFIINYPVRIDTAEPINSYEVDWIPKCTRRRRQNIRWFRHDSTTRSAFALFSSKVCDDAYHVPDDTLRDVQSLVDGFVTIYSSEQERFAILNTLMYKVLKRSLISVQNADGTAPDGIILQAHKEYQIPLLLCEEKNELEDGNPTQRPKRLSPIDA
ncbi:hypothetical protein K503DRAFT_799592 [Rhizopogon vinicolor AM-OR11-026]|uniref:Uncharacterized protein n=1 Tax=Rhizopogon vinicolor AM-OR11-026 TaxID=1314800 RepID=A0A1B7N3U5_9AGAM|nr:hypothetical protein K503DRAFT_799592 [Rhizopogon vinicolor AM-OR11-026]